MAVSHARRWLRGTALAAGAIGLIAVSAQALTRPRKPGSAVVLPAAASASATTSKGVEVSAQVQRYSVTLTATTKQAEDRLKQRVSGQLSIETAQTPSGAVELWRLGNVAVSASKNDGPASERQPAAALCRVRRSDSGSPIELVFARGSGSEQRRWLEFLIALAQHPSQPLTEPWATTERDGTGAYSATYSRRPDGALVRTKQSYDLESARAAGLKVESSEATLVLEAEALASVDARERLSFRAGALVVDSTAKVTRDGVSSQQSLDLADLERLSQTFAFGQASRESASEQDSQLAQGLTPQAGVAAVLHATSSSERRAAVKRLSALGRLNSAVLPAVDSAFAQAVIEPEPAIALLTATSQIGSQAAVDSLDGVARDPRQSERVQREALAALGEPRLPARAAYDKLVAHLASGPLRMTAALQLGALAYGAAAKDPATATLASASLWSEYERATNVGERGLMISALGNAADPRLLEELPGLHALEPALRARLILSLRRIPGQKAERAVAAAFHDPEPSVRQSALDVCAEWRDTRPCDGLEAVVLSDPNALTRERALRVLTLRATNEPARARALKLALQVAARDTAPRVRTAATSIAAELRAPRNPDAMNSFLDQVASSNPGRTP